MVFYNPLATADVVQHLMRWRGCYEYSLFQIWSKYVYVFYSLIYFGFQKHSEKSFYCKTDHSVLVSPSSNLKELCFFSG
jgi:hypothetical protein